MLARLLPGDGAEAGTTTLVHNRPFHHTAFVDKNLSFVILAALGEASSCRCRLGHQIRQSSAVFLRLTQDRIDAELASLRRRHLLAGGGPSCETCGEAFHLSQGGREFLASRLEEWQLSRLTSSAVNT